MADKDRANIINKDFNKDHTNSTTTEAQTQDSTPKEKNSKYNTKLNYVITLLRETSVNMQTNANSPTDKASLE